MIDRPVISLLRVEQTADATFGVLSMSGRIVCVSLELPWRSNMRGLSCIPCGCYRLIKRVFWSRKGNLGPTYEVAGVPDRTNILFHPANVPGELEGCIAPGTYVGPVMGQRGILKSRPAFFNLKKALKGVPEAVLLVSQVVTETGPPY